MAIMGYPISMIDLWARQAMTVMPEALEEGFRGFTWHIGLAMARRMDPIARTRAYCLPYGARVKMMLIDVPGASEYDAFSTYEKPIAVYPTWTPDEPLAELEQLCAHPVGENPKFYNNDKINPAHRPVRGQKHRVVVHRLTGSDSNWISQFLLKVRDLQAEYPVEVFISGLSNFDHLFSYDLKASDFRPSCMFENNIYDRITLPTGKSIKPLERVLDARYKDWFELIGISQLELLENFQGDRRLWPRFAFRSIQWARQNWDAVEAFVLDRRAQKPPDRDMSNYVLKRSTDFILPGTRARTMRRLGLKEGELDRFTCNTCILMNTCKLFREDSVCTVKGADTVSLAKAFGTRSADRIIDGLSKLLERQAERLDDALAAEDASDPNSDVTRQINSVFANGVKLAKLIDPALAGGPKVQVNVGVGAGGAAQIIASQDPRQITAQVVRELEAQGIPRESITAEMLAGYFKTMGITTEEPKRAAIGAVKAAAGVKERAIPEDRSPEEDVVGLVIGGEIVGEA
jgi:hypothetical protein